MTAEKHRFYPLKVTDVNRETDDTVSIEFEPDQEQKQWFQYKQGQYLTLKLQLNGKEYRRSYSLCTGVYENKLRVAVKKVENGVVSSFLNDQLKPGDVLEVMPPAGNFNTPLDPSNHKTYVALAAGSGITPIMSLLKTTLNTEAGSRFTLIYGNRFMQSVIFREELDRLQQQYPDRLKVIYVLSRESTESHLFEGRIDQDKLEELTTQDASFVKADEYFICGPSRMIETASSYLQARGVRKEGIHYELFTTPPAENDTSAEEVATTEMPASDLPVSRVTILLDDDETVIDLDKSGQAILDAAIAAGIDPPYSCKGAVCTTCMARLKEGKVKMDMNHALTDRELEDGYILTCQSHPVTDVVKVSYDDI